MATVVAVHAHPEHAFGKITLPRIVLLEGQGDAHCGVTVQHRSRVAADPSQPNLRQVHLIHAELFDRLAEHGFTVTPGQLGENITTRGLDLLALPVGARLRIDTAVLAVTGLRNPCQQINDFQTGLLKEVVFTADGHLVRLAGIMATVARGGTVEPGAEIQVQLPPPPHFPLTRV